MFKLKITKADKLFSLFIRKRDGFKCVRCGRQHERSENTSDSSHYWSRSMKGTRFDPLNADTLCKLPCHTGKHFSSLGWEYQKGIAGSHDVTSDGSYTKFKKKQLGEKAFNELMVRAHTPTKIDEKIVELWLNLELTNLKAAEKSQILGAH